MPRRTKAVPVRNTGTRREVTRLRLADFRWRSLRGRRALVACRRGPWGSDARMTAHILTHTRRS